MVKERITKITSCPYRTKSSFGNWAVQAHASFDDGSKTWEYPNKAYFFFTKTRATHFIEEAEHSFKQGLSCIVL